MVAYVTISETETDPGAPGTSELWKKWRDNPIAMAEGQTGAPKFAVKTFGGVGSQSSAYILTGLLPFNGVYFDLKITGSTSGSCILDFSTDGVTYAGNITIGVAIGPNVVYADFIGGTYKLLRSDSPFYATGAVTGLTAAATHMRVSWSGVGTFALMGELNGGESAS